LKPLDPQAAIGRCQLKKLPSFIEARKRNWEVLRAGLADLSDIFDFTLPTHAKSWIAPEERRGGEGFESAFIWDDSACRTDASWFGFMIRVKPSAGFTHTDLARHLDSKKIGNRMLFGGNLLRQPVFVQLKKDRPDSFRVVGEMQGADEIMNQALFLGTYPGLTKQQLAYEIKVIRDFVTGVKS
jgi:CDP-6-deoxy-D-xylo-4-hexulose-3-dehydrase